LIEWLESERVFYAEVTTELESKVLTVPEDKMRGLLAIEATAHEEYEKSKMQPAWKEIDSELEELPTALCGAGNDLMTEWVYVIDLDSELFSVNNWIFFDLWNIPRDRWIQAFGGDDEGRTTFSFEICPEGCCDLEQTQYFADDAGDERDKYHAQFQQWCCLTVQAISDVTVSSRAALQQIVAVILFEKLTRPYAAHFWEYLSGWRHTDLAFRELAFTILSFAASQLYVDNPKRFYRKHESDGYLIDRNEGGKPKLMPLFGSGCHAPDQEPGSAPSGSMYWFENVLISLVPDTVFEKDTEAAIAKAVEYGLEAGEVNFQVVLFSIFNAVMLEVHVNDGVKAIRHTEVVSIYDANCGNVRDVSDEDGETDTDETNVASPFQQIRRKHSGFVSLQNFFNTAANRRLSVYSLGCFPAELYAKIIANVDSSTRNACAKVSRTFRALCQERFSFGNNLTIFKFEASTYHPGSQNPRQRRPWVDLDDLGIFVFQDQNTGDTMRSGLSVRQQVRVADEKRVTTWFPVVGGVTRPSMITQCQLRVLLRAQNRDKAIR
jgi:hypothetical protein